MKRVMYPDAFGSIGTLDETIHGNGRLYVTWNYGKDKIGEEITSTQGYDKSGVGKFLEVPEELYQEYVNLPAWSEEQKPIRAKILEAVLLGSPPKTI